MYALTRIMNTMSAVMALLEMVPPHVGPTSVSLIWLAEIFASVARACRRVSACRPRLLRLSVLMFTWFEPRTSTVESDRPNRDMTAS